jgi:hypothetical protein
VPMDENGNPEYIEAKHGQYALMVFRIIKMVIKSPMIKCLKK